MDAKHLALYVVAAGTLAGISGCDKREATSSGSNTGAAQTGFPGQVSAGGGTSGEVMGRAGPVREGAYAGGTPGIAGGSGGNTGGAATGGSVQESGRGPSQGTTEEGVQSGGTPGIAGGSGGNTGGAATGGSVQEPVQGQPPGAAMPPGPAPTNRP